MAGRLMLLGLPREIQDLIWRQYFKDVVVFVYPSISEDEIGAKERRPRMGPHPALSILSISKAVTAVAVPAFFEHATFRHEGRAISKDYNFWNKFRSGFPPERFRKVSGDIDFALLLNRDCAVPGFPYALVKQVTVKDIIYLNVDDVPDILESIKDLHASCRAKGVHAKSYLIFDMYFLGCWGEESDDTTKIIINESGGVDLYMINHMSYVDFGIIKAWFDETFDNELIVPRWMFERDFIYVDESVYFEESSEWTIEAANP